MALPGQPLQVFRGGRPKRKCPRDPVLDGASKRRNHASCDRRSATRPLTSGERLWGATFGSSPYCSDKDKDIFDVRFERMANESDPAGNESEPTSQTRDERLRLVGNIKRCVGDSKLFIMRNLLKLDGLSPWKRGQGQNLQLRYGYDTSVVFTDGVFQKSFTRPEIGYVDLAQLNQRKNGYIMNLLQTAEGDKEATGRIEKEWRRIKPDKVEEDAQIALIMAAMAQEMLRSGKPGQVGVWVKVIGISSSEIFLYRAFVPKKFVQTFDASAGFVIKYRSASLKDRSGVLQQLHRLLTEEGPSGDQPAAA